LCPDIQFQLSHMDASTDLASHSHAGHPPSPGSGAAGDPHEHHDDHHELGFWRKYIISTDHKVIGIQYGISGLIFLFFGFSLMMLMRWQLAYPGQVIPVFGNMLERMFGPRAVENGVMKPEVYNSLGVLHGTFMIFLG